MHPTQKPVTGPDLSPDKVLRCAAIYLQRHGWHQGDMFATDNTPTPAACVQGAVKMAICGNPSAIYTPEQGALFDHTMAVLADQLDEPDFTDADIDGAMPSPGGIVADWNDQHGRTIGQVLTVLTTTADAYTCRHQGGAR